MGNSATRSIRTEKCCYINRNALDNSYLSVIMRAQPEDGVPGGEMEDVGRRGLVPSIPAIISIADEERWVVQAVGINNRDVHQVRGWFGHLEEGVQRGMRADLCYFVFLSFLFGFL